jgi:hypothetical protein
MCKGEYNRGWKERKSTKHLKRKEDKQSNLRYFGHNEQDNRGTPYACHIHAVRERGYRQTDIIIVYGVQSAVRTVQCGHCGQCSVQCGHCGQCSVQCGLCSVVCSVDSVVCSVDIVDSAVCSVDSVVCSEDCAVYSVDIVDSAVCSVDCRNGAEYKTFRSTVWPCCRCACFVQDNNFLPGNRTLYRPVHTAVTKRRHSAAVSDNWKVAIRTGAVNSRQQLWHEPLLTEPPGHSDMRSDVQGTSTVRLCSAVFCTAVRQTEGIKTLRLTWITFKYPVRTAQ